MRLRSWILNLLRHPRFQLLKDEFRLLSAVLIAAAGLLAFAGLAEEVVEGETHSFDRTILLALRNPQDLADPIGPVWVEEMARDLTSLGSFAILSLVTGTVIGFLLLSRMPGAALLVAIAIGGGLLASEGFKRVFERPRPDLVPHTVRVYSASFPSGHATLSAVTYLTLGSILARVLSRRRQKIYVLSVAIVATFLVGVSRVYLGVHWPTDVLAGWCLGAGWAMICALATLWLKRRKLLKGITTPAP